MMIHTERDGGVFPKNDGGLFEQKWETKKISRLLHDLSLETEDTHDTILFWFKAYKQKYNSR